MSKAPLLFATQSYQYLYERFWNFEAKDRIDGAYEPGRAHTETFPDGERYYRIEDNVDGRDVILLGGTAGDRDTLEIYDMAGAFVEGGSRSLTMVVPYFAYSTMERAVKPGEIVTAKSRARLLSSIPRARHGNRIILFDLHTEGLPFYFEGSLRAFHVYGKSIVAQAAMEICPSGDFVLACTDAGRAKWVESLANTLHVSASFVFKRRLSGSETQVAAVSAQVQGKHVIVYDDMIRSGSSLMGAARAYMDAGATKISAITSHGIFPKDAIYKLEASGLFTEIVVTDSHPRVHELMHPIPVVDSPFGRGFLKVKTIAPTLDGFLREHPISD